MLIRPATADDDERLVELWAGERPDRPADAVRRLLVEQLGALLHELGAARAGLDAFHADEAGRALWRSLGYEEVPEVVEARRRFGA